MSLSTPVALLIFNRPALTERVFKTIAKAQPTKLLVVADGPRFSEEEEKCQKTRGIIEKVDWDCEVLTNFSDTNLGCKRCVSNGLNWIFSEVEEAIILEDDCVPVSSFFHFCQTLLETYRYDDRIMHINGSNFQFGKSRTSHSYYFSKYSHTWGWASWRRAWQYYDVDMKTWPEYKNSDLLNFVSEHLQEQQYWTEIFEQVFNDRIDTWDYQWTYACWSQSGLSISPNVNLVSNIGFNSLDATHTKGESPLANLPTGEIWEIKHPPFLVRHQEADLATSYQVFGCERPRDFQKELETIYTQLHQLENTIVAMESSKFWQLRTQWFKLKKLLGLELHREETPQPQLISVASPSPQPEHLNAPQPQLISVASPSPQPEQLNNDKSPLEIPGDFDRKTVETILSVKPYTMTSPERIASLCEAVRYIVSNKIPGDIVECGVWKGGSMMAIAQTLLDLNDRHRHLYLFDTFEGMTPPTEKDIDIAGISAKTLLENHQKEDEDSVWCCANLDEVKLAVNSVGYDREKIHLIKGRVEETIPEQSPQIISLLRLDTDWYESTRHELLHLFPKISRGGIIIIDDYGHWQGARRAVDDYIQENNIKILLHRIDYTGRIGVVVNF